MDTTLDIITILYADDEVQACKWSAHMIGIGYEVLTVNSVEEAKTVLRNSHECISVVLTSFRTSGADGIELLRFIDAEYGDIATTLVTAYVDRNLPVQVVSTGRAFKTLEKPYQPEDVWCSLQGVLALCQDRPLRTQHLMVIDEALAFLVHKSNTPLAAISNFVRGIRMRVDQTEPTPGALPEIGRAADRVQNNARYCFLVVATFLSSMRNTYGKPGAAVTPNSVGRLIRALFDTYPFMNAQHEWATYRVEDDFPIQTLPNCMMLVFSLLTSNALQALRQTNAPKLEVVADRGLDPGNTQYMIRIEGNGPGIASDVPARPIIDPATTCAEEGGSGMGMIFYTRIMQSFGGAIAIDSIPSAGTRVTLTFP